MQKSCIPQDKSTTCIRVNINFAFFYKVAIVMTSYQNYITVENISDTSKLINLLFIHCHWVEVKSWWLLLQGDVSIQYASGYELDTNQNVIQLTIF